MNLGGTHGTGPVYRLINQDKLKTVFLCLKKASEQFSKLPIPVYNNSHSQAVVSFVIKWPNSEFWKVM